MTQQRESMSNVLEEEAKGWGCKREWRVAPERAGRGDGEQGSVQKQKEWSSPQIIKITASWKFSKGTRRKKKLGQKC